MYAPTITRAEKRSRRRSFCPGEKHKSVSILISAIDFEPTSSQMKIMLLYNHMKAEGRGLEPWFCQRGEKHMLRCTSALKQSTLNKYYIASRYSHQKRGSRMADPSSPVAGVHALCAPLLEQCMRHYQRAPKESEALTRGEEQEQKSVPRQFLQ
mmetsp:Transcript_25798/g.76195  ORF Transcript_25798/g.76195 Transcript_25798/m.76195 type:complete len:154 (+) Transcript_25798:1071-1532(+)